MNTDHIATPGNRPIQLRQADIVETWIRNHRQSYPDGSGHWQAVNELLDDYRLHAVTGTPLGQHACEHTYCCHGESFTDHRDERADRVEGEWDDEPIGYVLEGQWVDEPIDGPEGALVREAPATEPAPGERETSKWDNYPHNLPRETLIRRVKGHAAECANVEQILAEAMPELFGLGDGLDYPAELRAIGEHTPTTMAMTAKAEIERLRGALEADQGAEDARLVRQAQRCRGALVEIAHATGLDEPEQLPEWEISQAVRGHIRDAVADAAWWEGVTMIESDRRITAEHRFNAVTGRQGNEIGRLRKALAEAGGTGPAQAVVADWLRTHLGPIDVADQALVLTEEVGEVARAIVKRQQGIRGSRAEWTTALRHEIADTQIALLALAACEGVDLAEATRLRWEQITRRDTHARRRPHLESVTESAGDMPHAA